MEQIVRRFGASGSLEVFGGGPPGFSRGRVVRRGPRGSLDSRLGGVGGGPLQHVDLLLSGSSAAAPMEHPSGSASEWGVPEGVPGRRPTAGDGPPIHWHCPMDAPWELLR